VTIRGGGRPRESGADLSGVDIDEEYYATAPEPVVSGRRRPESGRAGGRTPLAPRGGSGFGWGGVLRLVLFIGVLAGIVLIASLTVLRPLVASSVVDWATENPSALGFPFVAQLVREDLGTALTQPASSDPAEVEFTVLDGDSAASIGNRLQEAGFLSDSRAFVFIATDRHLADRLQAGTYILRKNMTPDELVNALLVSRDIAVEVGLREGLRLEQITAKLETLPLTMDVKAFYDEVRSPPKKLLADYPWLDLPKGASLEGYLAPATYRVLPDITPDELIRRMLDRFYDTVGADRMKVPKERGMSFYQVLTLASIVEREAVLDDERALIAGVYQNRLDNPPRILNADPTVLYANDTMELAKLKFDDWKTYSFWSPPGGSLKELQVPPELAGYQTYIAPGLPPGPIATPTVESIDAALEPNDKAGYFYFVAIPDSGGKHAFAKTYKEHQANLKKYGY
jgi:peptidoglycan lytic transglycosylase G